MINSSKGSIFKNLIQVGMVVSDLRKSMGSFITYGIGPFYVLKFCSKNVTNMYIRGKRKNYSMNIGVCPIGDVRFEIIEPISQTIYSDYLEKYGEGIIHHLKLGVDNYQEALDYLTSMGIKVIQSGHQLGNSGKNIYNYLDTNKKLGFVCEIINVTPDFIKPKPNYWYPIGRKNSFSPIFKRPIHIGIVVKSLSEKIKVYSELFGVKCWHAERFSSENVDDMHVYGKRKDYSIKVALCNLGNVRIKLIEPLDESMFSDFYSKYGEGVIHHLGMEVDDYNKTLEYIKLKGDEIIQSGNYLGKVKYSYLSTSIDLNFIIEIAELKKIGDLIP